MESRSAFGEDVTEDRSASGDRVGHCDDAPMNLCVLREPALRVVRRGEEVERGTAAAERLVVAVDADGDDDR
jgi:hypothetical protein